MPALVCLAVLLTIAGSLIPSFLLPDRLLLLGQQVAPLALVAVGQTLVVLMGLIDLSVGAVLTLSLVLGAVWRWTRIMSCKAQDTKKYCCYSRSSFPESS